MTEWIVPCNPKLYDVFGAFDNLEFVDWKQTNPNVKVDDIVYIYVSDPIRAVMFKCKATKVNLSVTDIDDSQFIIDPSKYRDFHRHMELQLLNKYNKNDFPADKLKKNGLKGYLMGPRRLNDELSIFLSHTN